MSDRALSKQVDTRLSGFVSQERLWNRHTELGKIGATPTGGVDRQALTKEDTRARLQLMAWAMELGARPRIDTIGNLFLRYPGINPDLPAIMTGSHLDSQPTGGLFDGTYGVLAGLEVMEALANSGSQLTCPLDLVVWMNEEGSRFSPATMGSGVYADVLPIADVLNTKDREGVCLSDALVEMQTEFEDVERQPERLSCCAYLEAHIEQGPVLEDCGAAIGAVTGIQGLRQYEVVVSGKAAHAGTTPRSRRKDSLMSAVALISRISASIEDHEDQVRFTVGRLEVSPGTPNTVPSEVKFTIDLRHPDETRLNELEALIRCQISEVDVCGVGFKRLIHSPSVRFETELVTIVEDAASALGFGVKSLPSGATHDAASMAKVCPTAMIFVPCREGESHNENEWAAPEHLWAGACVLADVIGRLGDSVRC